jgi:hypothetical protein
MKPKTYQLLQQCIEDGIARGWMRAHKHHDKPSEDVVKEEIYNCILGSIREWFDFDDSSPP